MIRPSRINSIPPRFHFVPGIRAYQGRANTIEDVQDVVRLLEASKIPVCIVGVNALRFYGAGRVTVEWDFCVPDDKMKDAIRILEENDNYETALGCPPLHDSFRHLNPTFNLKETGFFFILVPSKQCFIDPEPEYCELSKNNKLPYPQMAQFGRSLLVTQKWADLEDFIDGIDLDEAWGEQNINFDNLQVQGAEFYHVQNKEMTAHDLGQYQTGLDYRQFWSKTVQRKSRRIEPLKQGRYKTRWRRLRNDIDPREKDRAFV